MKVLVIGLGSMGKRRIRLLKRFEEVTHIMGVDSREDRREEVRQNLGCDVCMSIEEALEIRPDIECAFICASPLSHSALISTALKNRLHVFTEMNLVADGYEENIRMAKETGRVLFLSSTFFFREEIQYIRQHIDLSAKLNYVYHIGQYLPDWHPWESYKDFFVNDKRTNGCREIMAIELPWLIGTFGSVKALNVVSDNISGLPIPYRDNYMIQLEHENGHKGTLIVDIVSPKAVRNLEIYGENQYFVWNGSPTSLECFDPETKQVQKVVLREDAEHIEGYSTFVVENAYQNEIRGFLDVVCRHTTPLYGFEEDLRILRLIDRIEAEGA